YIDDVIERMGGKKYFSTMDLKSGYYQVPLTENAQTYCRITMWNGTFGYRVLPFGLRNAPAYFQRQMEIVLSEGIRKGYVAVYIDDIIIFSDTFDDHLRHLDDVLS